MIPSPPLRDDVLPSDYADLEIRILRCEERGYPVEITFSGEQEFPRGFLDPKVLPWLPQASAAAEGELLFSQLFHDDRLKQAWAEARGQSRRRRLRLRIDEAAPELHALPWETLRDADSGAAADLAAAADTPLSRYLAGRWRPGRPVLERPIRILVAIANPENLDEYGLAALDAEAERRALEEAMADIESSQLELTFLEPPVTLAALDRELRKGYHLLHVVAHGVRPEGEPTVLFLADENQLISEVSESQLAEMLGRQDESLRLVYLSSCQSATRSPADAFRGLAPALVKVGVPAVLAMQDQVSIDTARTFAATFYRRLLAHGLADHAANEARSVVLSAGLPGAAIPVLFQRLRSGQLLARRGEIVGKRSESFWHVLLENIADGECTPVLGPRLTEGLLPGAADLARALASQHAYPLADSHYLPRVAQFVGTIDDVLMRRSIVRHLTAGFQRRLGQRPSRRSRRVSLSETIAAAGWPKLGPEGDETEVHHQLADLDLPLYLTTNFDNFMTLALRAKDRRVRRESVCWRQSSGPATNALYHDFDRPATSSEPVVAHLFGTDEDPLSMVLTEDDYLDYLACISRDHQHLLPTSVGEALARNTLLFLGYRLDDLDLKVILRGLLATLDLARWKRLHVAVQIDDSAHEQADPEEAQRYFQKYFGGSQIDVYWGSTQQFVADLHARWLEFLDE